MKLFLTRLVMTVLLHVLLVLPAVYALLPYPTPNADYEQVFLFKTQFASFYLNFTCRSPGVLSVSLTDQLQFQEHPAYDVFDGKPVPLTASTYTFLSQCQAQVKPNGDSLADGFTVVRSPSAKPVFTLSHFQLWESHLSFVVEDHSQKWGLGERFQHHPHITDGFWSIWNRDRPWEVDEGIKGKSKQTYGHQPVYLAREDDGLYHIALFKNTHGMLFEASGSKLKFSVLGQPVHWLLFLGDSEPEPLLEKYHEFIGGWHLPPFWAFGFHQCRWGYRDLQALKEVEKQFTDNGLPLDTIWTDLDYMLEKRDFTLDEKRFPPRQFNAWLREKQLRYIPLIDAGVSTEDEEAVALGLRMKVFLEKKPEDQFPEAWPGKVLFVDFLHPNATAFWRAQLARLFELVQFSGVWLDMNEPSNFQGNSFNPTEKLLIQQNEGINMMTINAHVAHYSKPREDSSLARGSKRSPKAPLGREPLLHQAVHAYYGHLMTVATFGFLREHGRPFIITRSNSVGTGRFAGHWTGDNVAEWQFLRLSVGGNFLFQIFGVPMVGADICGFHLNTTAELCARWMQLGSLYPFARNHNEVDHLAQEPYALGQDVLLASYHSLRLRYSLLKQLYTWALLKAGKGTLFRPLFFEFPDDPHTLDSEAVETQFLLGSSLLAAPVLEPARLEREVYLPGRGVSWGQLEVDSDTGAVRVTAVHSSSAKAPVQSPLRAHLPLFLRSGYILLTTAPALRSSQLSNHFHLTAVGLAEEVFEARGDILAISDYSKEGLVAACEVYGCVTRLRLERRGGASWELSWAYEGLLEIFSPISIVSVSLVAGAKHYRSQELLTLTEHKGRLKLTLS